MSSHTRNTSNPHSVTKSQIGLGNVNNTADSDKSVKYATSAGSANAVAWNNITGKPSTFKPETHTHTYIPKYVGSIIKTTLNSGAGEIAIAFSELGLTSRPSVLIATVQNFAGFATYFFDDSTDHIRIVAFQKQSNNTYVGAAAGTNVRLGIVVF